MRAIPADMDAAAVAAVDQRLDEIVRDHDVTIALAIESGSRAWGFPSPDSDYDCRFIFVRPVEQLLSPWVRRDVIETPLDGDLDVNGWDLGKALKLLLKGNAVVVEWLRSPIAYRGDEAFRDRLLEFAARFADRRRIARHYLHLGERQRRTYFGDGTDVALKKLFYAVRPAAALRWLRLHDEVAVPPMHFPTLIAESDPPAEIVDLIGDLIERKATTRELGAAPVPAAITRFLDQEFLAAHEAFEGVRLLPSPEATAEAETLYRRIVVQYDRVG